MLAQNDPFCDNTCPSVFNLITLLFAALLPSAHVKEIPAYVFTNKVVSIADVAAQSRKSIGTRMFFRIEGKIVGSFENSFILRDNFGSANVMVSCDDPWSLGDTVQIVGTHLRNVPFDPLLVIEALSITLINHGQPNQPVEVSLPELTKGGFDLKLVRFEGVVTDAFRDEVDTKWNILSLEADGETVSVHFFDPEMQQNKLNDMVDARVSVDGMFFPLPGGSRRYLGSWVQAISRDSIRTVTPPPKDPFSVDEISDDSITSYIRNSHRRKISGTVVAKWGGRAFFLRTSNGMRIEVHINRCCSLPPVGTRVTAAGFVRTNIFYPRLSNALVRIEGTETELEREEPVVTTPKKILFNETGEKLIRSDYNGRLVCICGIIRDIIATGNGERRAIMNCDGISVPALFESSITPPDVGSEIKVIGACLITTEANGSYDDFARLEGMSVIPRGKDDIVVLSQPPWWTPIRFLTVIGVLIILMVAILAWNISLRILANKRGHELFREQKARLQANMKVLERTKLAVELHDSISQTLTGIALLLDSVASASGSGNELTNRFLNTARQMLNSCRRELQGCLWDLRSRTFEEKDMAEAVMRTISPNVGNAKVLCRFDVPRRALSETMMHAALRIIRELVVNAVRHGKANVVQIAGEYRNCQLRFSVKDNGTGFAPESAAGPSQGHFGLQGVKERINDFNGSIKIESGQGKGAKVTVTMMVRKGED